jgi:predicted phage terminase large subunit-like protein
MTRWHMGDLAGLLLKRMIEDPLADKWVVICLSAIAEEWAEGVEEEEATRALKEGWYKGADPLGREPGEPLWPEHLDLNALMIIKVNVGGYEWVALFMQRPRLVEGQIIKANQIKIIEEHEVPAEVRPVRYWDLAVGRGAKANWLSGALGGKDQRKRFYIMDMKRIRPPWAEARPKIKKQMLEDPAEVVQGIEVSGQQDGYYQEFRDDEQLQMRSIVPVNPKLLGDKLARAQLWATRIEDDMVFMVRGPWNDDFIIECVGFPQAASDDQVDGVSGVWQMLPGVVEWSDVVQAANVPSRWNPFSEAVTWQR